MTKSKHRQQGSYGPAIIELRDLASGAGPPTAQTGAQPMMWLNIINNP